MNLKIKREGILSLINKTSNHQRENYILFDGKKYVFEEGEENTVSVLYRDCILKMREQKTEEFPTATLVVENFWEFFSYEMSSLITEDDIEFLDNKRRIAIVTFQLASFLVNVSWKNEDYEEHDVRDAHFLRVSKSLFEGAYLKRKNEKI